MSKKKNRPPSAQNLIDSLLDEKTPPKAKPSSPERYVSRERAAAAGSSSSDDEAILFDESAKAPAPAQSRGLPDPMDLTRSIAMDLQNQSGEIGGSYHSHGQAHGQKVSGDAVVYPSVQVSAPAESGRSRRPAPPPPPTLASPERAADRGPERASERKVEAAPAPAPAHSTQEAGDERTMRIDNFNSKKSKSQPDSDQPQATIRDGEPESTTPLKTQGPMPILTRAEAYEKPAPFTNDTIDRMMPTEIKTRAQTSRDPKQKVAASAYSEGHGPGFTSAEASLKQSESLRIAQKRITDLEQELERLRRENENLGTAGDTLRRRSDELLTKSENLEMQARENEKIHEEEKKVYRSQIQQKDRDLMEQRNRLEEMEGRLENNFKKIRVRERELEHRLEIIKMESATLVSGKDKMILDLKRQLDQLAHENDYGKQKSAELYNQFQGKQDTIRRVVRALRIALTILEGDEDASSGSSPRSSKRDE